MLQISFHLFFFTVDTETTLDDANAQKVKKYEKKDTSKVPGQQTDVH